MKTKNKRETMQSITDARSDQERVSEKILRNPSAIPMSAIVLFGGNSCGKSSTLQHLAVLLCGGGILNTKIQKAFEEAFYDKGHDCYRDFDLVVNYYAEKLEESGSLYFYGWRFLAYC